MVIKSIMGALSPAGRRARLSIFIFHRVLSQQDPLFPDEPRSEQFDQVLGWLSKWFQVLPLDQAVAQLRSGTLPARAAAITFDDGYADNASNALPILKRHGMTATFFVATSFLDGGRMWNDTLIEAIRGCQAESLNLSEAGLGRFKLGTVGERRLAIDRLLVRVKYLDRDKRDQAVALVQRAVSIALPDDLMMTSRQVVQLRDAGMQIGAHTHTHPILARLPDSESLDEIKTSKRMLETLLGEPVSLFAYPNGKPDKDYLDKHAEMVRQAGFAAAVSTAAGVSSETTSVFHLPRFTPWDRTQLPYAIRLMRNLRAAAPQVA